MKTVGLLLFLLCSACASVSKEVQLTHEGVPQAELLVFRESTLLAAGMGLYFGKSDKYFFVLDNGQYSRVKIDAGGHVFQAKAHASPAFELKVDMKAGKTTCIKGKANPAVAGVVLIPILGNAVSNFTIEEVECPSDDALKSYKLKDNP